MGWEWDRPASAPFGRFPNYRPPRQPTATGRSESVHGIRRDRSRMCSTPSIHQSSLVKSLTMHSTPSLARRS